MDGPHGSYRVVSSRTGLALTAVGRASHQLVIQLPFVGDPSQLWHVDRDFNGYFRISTVATGALLALDGTRPATTLDTDSPAQKWLPIDN